MESNSLLENNENVMDKEKIITFIQERSRNGEQLYLRYMVRNYPEVLRDAKKIFGSWRSAIESAGISYETVMKQRKIWDREKIKSRILELHSSGKDMWYRAVVKEHKDLVRAAESHFGGWREAVVASGLDYSKVMKRPHQIWNRAKIIERIKELAKEGKDLKYDSLKVTDRSLLYAIEKYYGSLGAAFEAAGIPYSRRRIQRGAKELKIYTVKTRLRSEKNVGDEIIAHAKDEGVIVGAVHYPPKQNGYIFVECESRESLAKIIVKIRQAQGILGDEISREEMQNFIYGPRDSELQEGMHVIVTDGKFKGEKAVIKYLNKMSKKVTIELIDQPVVIPVTIDETECKPA